MYCAKILGEILMSVIEMYSRCFFLRNYINLQVV